MSKDLNWVRWWVSPWKNAHSDWCVQKGFIETSTLSRSHHQQVSRLFEIEPELPPLPSAPVLQLVLTGSQQRDFALLLIKEVCNPSRDSRLNSEQHLWCQRLTKALAPDPMLVILDDPLHCLRAWVSPAVWQRLRLSFDRLRVLELETHPRHLNPQGRLDTLWQAALWRATSTTVNETPHPPS
ncbi:type III secretion protein [Pseudomonas syringae]|uniref:type III secretion protein n=1 Tax=Pseudomonas syringae TaxID=317 RepID=UPI001F1B4162|nr:type III secretion protein [Pseudomonas syringae]MCF5721593.1 type III secretion protein [Pseudomonas syringae]